MDWNKENCQISYVLCLWMKNDFFLLFVDQIALWIEHVTFADSPLYRLEMGLKTRPYRQPHPYQCRQCCEINKSSEKKFNQFMLTVKPHGEYRNIALLQLTEFHVILEQCQILLFCYAGLPTKDEAFMTKCMLN